MKELYCFYRVICTLFGFQPFEWAKTSVYNSNIFKPNAT